MLAASRYYYKAQLIGWSVYILIAPIFLITSGNEITFNIIGGIYLVFVLGLIFSHLYRLAIIKLGWLDKDIFSLIPRIAAACIALAILFQVVYISVGNLAFRWNLKLKLNEPNTLTWGMLFFIWSLI